MLKKKLTMYVCDDIILNINLYLGPCDNNVNVVLTCTYIHKAIMAL